MNTYLVWRYLGHGKNRYEWSGCGFWTRISDEAMLPIWQVRAPSLREAIRYTAAQWRFRQMSQLKQQMSKLQPCNEPPEVVQ